MNQYPEKAASGHPRDKSLHAGDLCADSCLFSTSVPACRELSFFHSQSCLVALSGPWTPDSAQNLEGSSLPFSPFSLGLEGGIEGGFRNSEH